MGIRYGSDIEFLGGATVKNVPTPTESGDAAPKSYVDSAVEGLAWKDSCRVATQSNINLASPGATIDGLTMALGDRVLVNNQSSQSQNGIYIWNGASTALTRSLDASTFVELEQAVTTIEEGTNAGGTYRQTQLNGTIDSSNIIWTVFGSSVPSASEGTAGRIAIATQSEVDAGTSDEKAITPLKLATYAGLIRKFTANFGDGSNTSYTITHNLGTRDVHVSIFPNSGNYDDVIVETRRPSTNAVTIVFASAPSSNAYRVVIIG